MADEWGPWIEHDGKGCPLPVGTYVMCGWEEYPGSFYVDEGFVGDGGCFGWDWKWWLKSVPGLPGICARVVRYRVRKSPSLGFKILQKIAATPSQPVREDA